MESSSSDAAISESGLPSIETSFDIQSESDVEISSSAPTPVVAGVEENVNSRFIDYSIATPWEDLIASIERVLRSWKPYVSMSSTKAQQLESRPSFSVNIDYNGTKMKLDFMDGCKTYCSDDTGHSKKHYSLQNKVYHYFYSEEIPLWFGLRKYVLLTRYNGSILGESERRLMFSALIGALDASQVQIPAFVSASPSTSTKQSLEILGYMIMSPRLAEITLQSQDSVVTSGPKVVHFESQTLANVGSKHPFFYLDGLMRLFGTKLWKFSRGNISVSDESANVVVSAVEFYEFRCMSAARVQPTSPRLPLSPTTSSIAPYGSQLSSPVMKCTLDDFLICFPFHINNENNGTSLLENDVGHEFSQVAHQNALALLSSSQEYIQTKRTDTTSNERYLSDSSGRGSDHSALLQAYNSAAGGSHPSTVPDARKKFEYQLPLEKILVQVSFRDLKHDSVVDNDYYTTLLPSKVPPSAWAAKATFASIGTTGKSRGSSTDILSPPSVSPLFATSLRRLLALYVCGKSARSDSTFRTISDSLETYGNLQGCISTDRAIDISSVLSVESRRAVVFLCASASIRGSTVTATNSKSLHQDLLMRVFSRSLWVDDSSKAGGGMKATNPPCNRPSWDWLSRLKERASDSVNVTSSAPVGSWMSLVSVYMSSFETVTSMVTFWQECIDEVRVHWENRVPIPRLYPPIPIMKSSSEVKKSQ